MSKIDNKDVVAMFFSRIHPTLDRYKCVCTKEFKQDVKSGYSNLMGHIKRDHPNYESKALDLMAEKARTGTLRQMTIDDFIDAKAYSTMRWLRLLISKNLPLSYCDDPEFIDSLKEEFKRVSIKTLKNRMALIVKAVEVWIKTEVAKSSHLGLLFDGWSERGTHYLAMFAVTPSKSPLLLAFSPFINEETMTAAEHVRFTDFVLDVFGIQASKLKLIIGDNCNTNKAYADLVHVPFVGCASHRLSLGINKGFLPEYQDIIQKVNRLMVKLGTIKRQGKI